MIQWRAQRFFANNKLQLEMLPLSEEVEKAELPVSGSFLIINQTTQQLLLILI